MLLGRGQNKDFIEFALKLTQGDRKIGSRMTLGYELGRHGSPLAHIKSARSHGLRMLLI